MNVFAASSSGPAWASPSGPIPGTPLYQAVRGGGSHGGDSPSGVASPNVVASAGMAGAMSSCPCGMVLAESRSMLASLSASAAAIARDASDALRSASSLTWEGTAGDLFRRDVDRAAVLATEAERGAHETAALIAGAGALS
ncbi:hypothetical protein [Bifidobacterium simiarum]|uniref:hypothetical protein n=1 Tax=Bifidobacterium simiarum TaxID=2045441 RepID=UPI001BDC103E|nr:hypothetical protein [Bifidobacterium simiarum]MBT1165866.1 hypothetical protein [Bifidobacterium simiarum]